VDDLHTRSEAKTWIAFEAADGGVEGVEQFQVGLDPAADLRVGDGGRDRPPPGPVFDVAGHRGQVELAQGGVDVATGAGSQADEAEAGAEQVAQAAALVGTGRGEREVAAAERAERATGVAAARVRPPDHGDRFQAPQRPGRANSRTAPVPLGLPEKACLAPKALGRLPLPGAATGPIPLDAWPRFSPTGFYPEGSAHKVFVCASSP
jgi:hypothetical protein